MLFLGSVSDPQVTIGLFESRREMIGVKTHMAESYHRGPAGDGTNGRRAVRTHDSGKIVQLIRGSHSGETPALGRPGCFCLYCQTSGGHSGLPACSVPELTHTQYSHKEAVVRRGKVF